MNIVWTLEKLGYDNGTDFTYRKSTGLVWLSGTPQPTDQELQDAYNQFILEEEPELLEAHRSEALKRVDAYASRRRADFISFGVGQELVYNEKAKQAQEFIDGGYVNVENYPFIQAEASATGTSPTAVADTIIANRIAWMQIGAEIEGLRLSAKEEVRAVTTIEQFGPIFQQLIINLNSVGT